MHHSNPKTRKHENPNWPSSKIFMANDKEVVDQRILHLLEHSTTSNHRAIIGVNGQVKDVAHHIHALLSRHIVRPRVLWVYEKELEMKNAKLGKAKKRKSAGAESLSNFESFVVNTEITYLFHSETEKALGTTTDLCVLQDFSQIRANALASVVESVKGGGIIILSVTETNSIFIQRLYKLLSTCNSYLIVDSQLKVLKESFIPSPTAKENSIEGVVEQAKERIEEKKNLLNPLSVITSDSLSILMQLCRTKDQIDAVIKMGEILDQRTTVAVTADRGRGKSAALGLTVALAIVKGMNDVLITSPHISNVQTLFEFIVLGLNSLGYKEQKDYHIDYSKENKRAIEKIVVSKTHYQTVRFLPPQKMMYSPSLLVVDEAAAIPLTLLKEMMGMYPVLLSSTTAGYEGTGRALSLKFFKVVNPEVVRLFEPIRYGENDPVEAWLNKSLSLSPEIPPMSVFPAFDKCSVFALNKEKLFSGSEATEKVLASLASILLSGHYKNTPNDMQILADSQEHTLLALVSAEGRVLGLAQVVREGKKSEACTNKEQTYRTKRTEEGDLIPWTLSQYYLDLGFFDVAGVRVVRIAIHPDAQSMGYGSHLVGKIISLIGEPSTTQTPSEALFATPALDDVDYIGVSFGVTPRLLNFWSLQKMSPAYLKHTVSKSTGENSLIMLKGITPKAHQWIARFNQEFSQRMMELLPGCFRSIPSIIATQLITPSETRGEVFSAHDVKRMQQFSRCNLDLRIVADLLPRIAKDVFLGGRKLQSSTQRVILISLGLQHKSLDSTAKELGIPASQVHVLLAKTLERLSIDMAANMQQQ
ncbi:N-acetyltransferase 1 [Nematocida displodere]|uniref:N-acetyltransferase 1 n=1 Tax=Nematocida displodere TaxID=1805483 RepID=A0A177EI24_9MICR|nr:N-acetyltransferase 1 [Nematocida displodere]